MSEITLKYTFGAAGVSPYSPSLGPALLVQTDGMGAEVFGSNLPGDESSWQSLGTCTGYTPLDITTSFAYLRVAADGAGTVAISAATAPAGGSGGASSGGLTDDELRASPVPVSATALPLPTGAATESTLAAASAKLPASLGAKAGAASLSIVAATLTRTAMLSAATATGAGSAVADAGGAPSFSAEVSGTGSVAATVLIQARNAASGQWLTLGTITLSGTTAATDGFASLARYMEYLANLTAVSGTGAAVTVTMGS